MSYKLILISGYDRSGKSTAANISKAYGFMLLECGAFVKVLSDSSNKIDISLLYEQNMKEFNSKIISSVIDKCSSCEMLVVVGVRSIDLYNSLKDIFPNLKLVFIESKQDLRYQRHLSENTLSINHDTWDTFNIVDRMQTKWGLSEIKQVADFVVQNNESSTCFELSIKELLENL